VYIGYGAAAGLTVLDLNGTVLYHSLAGATISSIDTFGDKVITSSGTTVYISTDKAQTFISNTLGVTITYVYIDKHIAIVAENGTPSLRISFDHFISGPGVIPPTFAAATVTGIVRFNATYYISTAAGLFYTNDFFVNVSIMPPPPSGINITSMHLF